MIESLADRMVNIAAGRAGDAEEISIGSYRIAATLNELAENYDLVLIDAGPHRRWTRPLRNGCSNRTWACRPTILAYDARRSAPDQVAAGCLQIAQAGLRQLGLAEMFADDRSIALSPGLGRR